MKTSWILSGLVALAVAWGANAEENPGQDKKHDTLMRKKLEYSQRILEGLATEDFEMIRQNAKFMNTATNLESRLRSDSPRYRAQLNIFLTAGNEMMRFADEKNLQGASLAYTQMTLSCVNCHQFIRDQEK